MELKGADTMIDKTVIRGETKTASFASFGMKFDGSKAFTEYGLEYIREVAKLLLVQALCNGKGPEAMDDQIRKILLGNISKAAYFIALDEIRKIVGDSPANLEKVVKQVLLGEGEEDEKID